MLSECKKALRITVDDFDSELALLVQRLHDYSMSRD